LHKIAALLLLAASTLFAVSAEEMNRESDAFAAESG
jgi:hypothetical protein